MCALLYAPVPDVCRLKWAATRSPFCQVGGNGKSVQMENGHQAKLMRAPIDNCAQTYYYYSVGTTIWPAGRKRRE